MFEVFLNTTMSLMHRSLDDNQNNNQIKNKKGVYVHLRFDV